MSEYAVNDFRRMDQRTCFQKRAKEFTISSILSSAWLPTPVQITDDRRFQSLTGSGKSLAIEAHASVLASKGKQILICSFNITLINHLRYLVARHVISLKILRKQEECGNFHNWCDGCEGAGYANIYRQIWQQFPRDTVLDHHMVDLICESIKTSLFATHFRSTMPFWLVKAKTIGQFNGTRLREAVTPEGEKLLVADKTRNVYGIAYPWT